MAFDNRLLPICRIRSLSVKTTTSGDWLWSSQPLVHGNGHEPVSRMCVIAEIRARRNWVVLAVVQTEETQQGVEHFAHTVRKIWMLQI